MMKHAAISLLTLGALTLAISADAATDSHSPVKGWSAMADVPVPVLLEQAQSLPVSDLAIDDQPYCAPDAEIAATLRHDFDEAPVETRQHGDLSTHLWGSAPLGTWTVVAPRADGISCIIASGTGFAPDADPAAYYNAAGLG